MKCSHKDCLRHNCKLTKEQHEREDKQRQVLRERFKDRSTKQNIMDSEYLVRCYPEDYK
jgi:hypothetical protein